MQRFFHLPFDAQLFDIQAVRRPDIAEAVTRRLLSLTKPPGSLGRLEELVLRFGCQRNDALPPKPRAGLYLFCADHGVTREGVSAFPSEVTRQMVENFARGGAAVNVLCRMHDVTPQIVDMGVVGEPTVGVLDHRLGPGTGNLRIEPAMTVPICEDAMQIGVTLAQESARKFDVAAVGEMGIGNTTSAAALLCVFGDIAPTLAVGRGTGLDDQGVSRKAAVIADALALHPLNAADPVQALAAVGGFEIAAMAGFLLGAAAAGLPVMLDGFVTCAAALPAFVLAPAVRDWCYFSHLSAEQGHGRMIEVLGGDPLLSLGMRLGEGSGAVLGVALLKTAMALYRDMATFGEAGVADQKGSNRG